MKKHYFSISLLASITLFACQSPSPSISASSPPAPSSTLVPSPSATPTPAPTPVPSPSATPTPEPTPVPSPSATSTPEPTPVPSPSATPTPEPTPLPKAELQIKVYDENSSLLSSAFVKVESNSPSVSFSATSVFKDGRLLVENIPVNLDLLISASAPGYTERKITRVFSAQELKPVVEFKNELAISNRPEIVAVSPEYGKALDPYGTIKITFSENMKTDSVEKAIAIQTNVAAAQSNFYRVGLPVPAPLSFLGRPQDTVYDVRAFKVEWDTDRVLKLTPRLRLPNMTNRNIRLIFSYLHPSGGDGIMRDSAGNPARSPSVSTQIDSETGKEKVLEDGAVFVNNRYQPFIPFVLTDTVRSISLRSVQINNQDPTGDSLLVNFSAPLKDAYPAHGAILVGGADGTAVSAPAGLGDAVNAGVAVKNYTLRCNDLPVAWPGSAIANFTEQDQVKIQVTAPDNLFNSGDQCTLNTFSVRDYAGELLDNSSFPFSVP